MDRLLLLMGGLAGVLLLSGLAAWLWPRLYRDDAANPVRRVVKNSAVPLVARLVVRGLDLVFAVILLSTLPGDVIGRYALAALLVAQYLGTFTDFGLGVLLTREVARRPGAARDLFGTTLLLRWLLVLACVPLAALLIGSYGLLGRLGLGEAITPVGQQAIWVLLLTLVPGAYSGAVTALYHAAERMEVPALVELVTAVLSMLVRVGVLLLGFGILGLAWAAVGVSTITALVYLWLQMRSFFAPVLRWNGRQAAYLLLLSLPLMLNNLLNVVFFRFDTFLIKAFGAGNGDLLLQQYTVAYQVLNIALILPPVVTFAIFPMLARRAQGARPALAQAQNRTLHLLLLLALPLAVGICLLAPDLVRFFTRSNADQYLPISAHVLAILAWFLPLSFANGLLQYVLIAIDQQHAITRAFLLGAGFNLATNLLAIPLLGWLFGASAGLYAASVITILSEVVLLAVFLPLLRRAGLNPPLLRLAVRPTLAAGMMGGALLWLTGSAEVGWFGAALLVVPVYGLALWLLGAIGPEEWALVRRLLGRSPSA